ncbi:MAG: DUF1501 domain-containing protein [Granulosicoccus sp.]|nr:DUF1501 domain-containing protein [Granulosicoccus sp.]
MNRRDFLRKASLLGFGATAPTLFGVPGFVKPAWALQSMDDADFILPEVMPQVINVFLYGGPSELAGNLTNMDLINRNSQNPYPEELRRSIDDGGQVTRHGFWAEAGGLAMEDMLASGDLSVYRTINRRKNNTRAHRPSVFSSLKGSLAIEAAPGMGSTIAALMHANGSQLNGSAPLRGKHMNQLVLPFVSFEGSSTAFVRDPDGQLPLHLRGLSLDEQFDNPYTRGRNDHDLELEALIAKVVDSSQRIRYQQVAEGLELRRTMEQLIGELQSAADSPLPSPPPIAPGVADPDTDPTTGYLAYPANNRFSARIKAAVTLAVENQDSLFITVGGGLGGWDDHASAMEDYVPRMNQVMEALRVAMKHIRYADISHGGRRRTDNIVIKVHGDFGRNVNLNNSQGWDHGNNQNLYTLGGAAIRPNRALGKVVGRTDVSGPANQNRQYTQPADGSYEAEPLAIASTLYKYFGAQNPQALTRDAEQNPAGDAAINETYPPEPPVSI